MTTAHALNSFLQGHIKALSDEFTITVCLNKTETLIAAGLPSDVEIIHFPISRKLTIFNDLYCLMWLMHFFLRRRFDAVHSLTPKGGLLGMIAAKFTFVSLRTHTFTGQVWANRQGFMKKNLQFTDRLIAICANEIHADSKSQRQVLEKAKICSANRVTVFGEGSIAGVDIKRFAKQKGRGTLVRNECKIPKNALVFTYLGRLSQDKGVLVLADSFKIIAEKNKSAFLLVVGPDEEDLKHQIEAKLKPHNGQFKILGRTEAPEKYLDATDILCLPSYREGFGNVIIEAAAFGIPCVATRIYGVAESAVIEGITGLLSPAGDTNEFALNMEQMTNSSLRNKLGKNAQRRVHKDFSAEDITQAWVEFYRSNLRINRK